MSVTFSKGFKAAGVKTNIKNSNNLDFAIVKNEGPNYNFACCFTPNRFAAAPVLFSRQQALNSSNKCSIVAINSGNANACTGSTGLNVAKETAKYIYDKFDIDDYNAIQVCSTGKIGVNLDLNKIKDGIDKAKIYIDNPDYDNENAGIDAANAIMTTDTSHKTSQRIINTASGSFRVGGMVKGAGMIAPGMATMICVITTDAIVENEVLSNTTKKAVDHSFNRIDSDGCMSTNDTVLVLANGSSEVQPQNEVFYNALLDVMKELAAKIINDAEGASHDVKIRVVNAFSEDAALSIAREVSRSNLLKCALFGGDPNWGRVLSSVGVVPENVAPYNPENVDVYMNNILVCQNGSIGESVEGVKLNENRLITIIIDLKSGNESAEILTNDLTYEYVEVNAEYST